jgi:hypothetical protein
MRIPRLTYSNAVATIALFVALGGSSYAAVTITGGNVKNGTLTGSDLKNGTVKATDVGNSSLTGSDIKNASLAAVDFKAGELPAGPAGPAGPQGPAGPAGPQGAPGATNVVTRRRDVPIAPGGGTEIAFAECQAGEVAVGGGAGFTGPLDGTGAIYFDEPREADGTVPEEGDVPTRWAAGAANSSAAPRSMFVFVVCASP